LFAGIPPEDGRDQRFESRKGDMSTVCVLEKAEDDEIREIVASYLSPYVGAIERTGASLGFIKPAYWTTRSRSLAPKQLENKCF